MPYLESRAEGLTLTDGNLELRGDFTDLLPRLQPRKLSQELLVRASKIKGLDRMPVAIDATAGMGEDSFLLAAAGFQVKLFEQDATICALLKDALERAKQDERLHKIASRMEVLEENSIHAMHNLGFTPDVIYLDPMFPKRQKSALIKKKFQLLQQLESPSSQEEELFMAAWEVAPRKLIIKRPVKGPYLAGKQPEYCYLGKAVRYDCFSFAPHQS